MKKLISILSLALIISFTFASCGLAKTNGMSSLNGFIEEINKIEEKATKYVEDEKSDLADAPKILEETTEKFNKVVEKVKKAQVESEKTIKDEAIELYKESCDQLVLYAENAIAIMTVYYTALIEDREQTEEEYEVSDKIGQIIDEAADALEVLQGKLDRLS